MTEVTEAVFVGIDVSKETLELGFSGRKQTEQFANSHKGIEELTARLRHTPGVQLVVLEATGGMERLAAAGLCAGGWAV
ncbi:MAG TPA: IS110 family transposase, partial [Ramlibacter sp.]|nr:IS110 family transposase [Ramlibacter sp.]